MQNSNQETGKKHILFASYGQRLCLNDSKGAFVCPSCKNLLRVISFKEDIIGYLCPNRRCVLFNIEADSPTAFPAEVFATGPCSPVPPMKPQEEAPIIRHLMKAKTKSQSTRKERVFGMCAVAVALYALAAFITWTASPAEWPIEVRLGTAAVLLYRLLFD